MDDRYMRSWIRALRSGNFKRTTQLYYNEGAYCAVGVLLKISGLSDKDMRMVESIPKPMRPLLRNIKVFDIIGDNDTGIEFDEIANRLEAGHYTRNIGVEHD